MGTVASVQLDGWSQFRQRLEGYFELPLLRRRQLVFRGHASADWPLKTTLDRARRFATDTARNACLHRLIAEFRREASGLRSGADRELTDSEWELLARHHGLPTPILDWTSSPFVAAYFAFADSFAPFSETASIWVLDREAFVTGRFNEIEVIDDVDRIRFNPRAIEQRGVFLRIGSAATPVEDVLSKFLYRYDVPMRDRHIALAELDQMLVNGRTLFRDLDGAARSAAWRAMQQED